MFSGCVYFMGRCSLSLDRRRYRLVVASPQPWTKLNLRRRPPLFPLPPRSNVESTVHLTVDRDFDFSRTCATLDRGVRGAEHTYVDNVSHLRLSLVDGGWLFDKQECCPRLYGRSQHTPRMAACHDLRNNVKPVWARKAIPKTDHKTL